MRAAAVDELHQEAFLAGEPDAIARVETWIESAIRPFRRSLGNDVEDLRQDVLLALTHSLRAGKFRGRSSLHTYVRMFCQHKCIDRVRARSRRELVDLDHLGDAEQEPPEAWNRLRRADQRRLALRALEAVPEHCRQLWRMILDGLSYREMSRRTGIAEGTLRVRVSRCRQLASELTKELRR